MANVAVINGTIKGMISITPSDTVELDERYNEALYVQNGGNVKITFNDDSVDTINVPSYSTIQAKIKLLWANGTTATGFHGIRYQR